MKLRLPKTLKAGLLAAVIGMGAFGTAAMAVTKNGYTIIGIGDEPTGGFADYYIATSGVPATAVAGTWHSDPIALGETGINYIWGIEAVGGRVFTNSALNVTADWNADALTAMNAEMGTSITTTQLGALHSMYAGKGNSVSSLTLDCSNAAAEASRVQNGQTITFYVGIAPKEDTNPAPTPGGYTVSGLANATITYATETGNGFQSDAAFSTGVGHLTVLKVTGTVLTTDGFMFRSYDNRNDKTGAAFIAYKATENENLRHWNGTEGANTWSSAVWNKGSETGTTITSGQDAFFDVDGAYKTVAVDQDVAVGAMSVNDNYTFNLSGDMSVSVLAIAADKKLTLDAATAHGVSISELQTAGSLQVQNQAKVTLVGDYTGGSIIGNGTVQLDKNNNSAVNFTGNSASPFEGTLVINQATSVSNHNASINLQNFAGTVELRGRMNSNTFSGHLADTKVLRLVGDRSSNNTGLWDGGQTIEALTNVDVEVLGDNYVELYVSNNKTTTLKSLNKDTQQGKLNLTSGGQGTLVVNGAAKLTELKANGQTIELKGESSIGKVQTTGNTTTLRGTEGVSNTVNELVVDFGSSVTITDMTVKTATTAAKNISGNVTIGAGTELQVVGTDSLNYDISADRTVRVEAGGTLAFGNKRWTVGAHNKIVVNGGSITGAGEGANGALDFYQNGGTLSATDISEVSAAIRLRNDSDMTNFSVDDTKTLTLSGKINGDGKLKKIGTGTMVVSGNNAFTGGVTVAAGTLESQHANALGTGSVSVEGGTLKLTTDTTLGEGSATVAVSSGKLEVAGGTTTVKTAISDVAANLTVTEGVLKLDHANAATLSNNTWMKQGAEILLTENTGFTTGNITMKGKAGGTSTISTNSATSSKFDAADNSEGFTLKDIIVVAESGRAGSIAAKLDHVDVVNDKSEFNILWQEGSSLGTVTLNQNMKITGAADGVGINVLSIGGGKVLGVYSGSTAEETAESSVTVGKSLSVGHADGAETKLLADLVLADGSTLNFAGTLTMGSTVELGSGLNLSGSLLNSLLDGSTDSITLFDSVEALTLGGAAYSHELYASEVFVNADLQNTDDKKFVLSYDGSNVTLYTVPEPATATLGLLALAALASRRRRR